ncbi:hypothetical protein DID77_04050, partial [Candidatus Marinamargulisbacteria bacterium SCGC AG-439-L15]
MKKQYFLLSVVMLGLGLLLACSKGSDKSGILSSFNFKTTTQHYGVYTITLGIPTLSSYEILDFETGVSSANITGLIKLTSQKCDLNKRITGNAEVLLLNQTETGLYLLKDNGDLEVF